MSCMTSPPGPHQWHQVGCHVLCCRVIRGTLLPLLEARQCWTDLLDIHMVCPALNVDVIWATVVCLSLQIILTLHLWIIKDHCTVNCAISIYNSTNTITFCYPMTFDTSVYISKANIVLKFLMIYQFLYIARLQIVKLYSRRKIEYMQLYEFIY